MGYLRKARPGKMRVEFYELEVVGIATEQRKDRGKISTACVWAHTNSFKELDTGLRGGSMIKST